MSNVKARDDIVFKITEELFRVYKAMIYKKQYQKYYILWQEVP